MVAYRPMSVPSRKSAVPHDSPQAPLAEQLRYWAQQLDGVTALDLPIDQTRPDGMPSATGAQSFVVPRDVAAGLRVLTAHLDVSLLDLAVAAYQLVLARHSGQDDIVVAIPSPGRHHPVLLRSGVRDSIPFRDFLIKVRATAAAASIHADVPFQQVVEQLGLDRALARFAVASVDRPALSWPADLTAGLRRQASSRFQVP